MSMMSDTEESDKTINSSNEDEQGSDNVKSVVKRKIDDNDGKQKKIKKNKLYRPPTTDELNQLKETEQLYNSNLYRLQIEELLTEIKISETQIQQLNFWLKNFEQFIETVEGCEDIQSNEIVRYKGRKSLTARQKFINQLFENSVDIKCDHNVTIKFGKPDSFKILGEYALNSVTNIDLHVNISLKIPETYLLEKDYLNYRYFVKCYYYLVFIFVKLKETVLYANIDILFQNGVLLLPFIQIIPQFCENVIINIFVSGSESQFKLNRFQPEKNNIKFDGDPRFQDLNVKLYSAYGTPLYNSIMARDMTLHLNYSYMESVLNLNNIQDAIKLVHIWLRQRCLNKGFGSFSPEIVLYVMAYLRSQNKINQHMSSYQVIRMFWSFLCNTNWSETPISIFKSDEEDHLNFYKKCYTLVFLDFTGFYNVTSFLNLDIYLKVRREAHLAIKMSDDAIGNTFASLFITKLPFALQHDAVIKLLDEDWFNCVYNNIKDDDKWHYYGFYSSLIINEITNILKKGFGARVYSVVPQINDSNVSISNINTLKTRFNFGINLNSEHAFNPVEKAPLEDKDKAKEFRLFWSDRSDLRRFNDGTVCEAVYFNCSSIREKRLIFQQIIKHLFTEKLNLCVHIISDQFEKLLNTSDINYALEENCIKIKTVYDDLTKKLREIKLPLVIASIQGTSDVFSCTELVPPFPVNSKVETNMSVEFSKCLIINENFPFNSIPTFVRPITCVVQFGLNSKWPSDVKVLRCFKTEIHFEISSLLNQEYNIQCRVHENFLDIFYEGFIFRIKLYIPKEVQLLKRTINQEGLISYQDNEESINLEKELDIMPKITSALNGINSEIISFGPCCALIKRWLRSQLIDGYHISDTVINLLNASLYLNRAPYEKSILPQIGFLRFLQYTSEINWNLNPIIVNFNNELDNNRLHELQRNFHENKQNFPDLYIITPYDNGKSIFTKSNPTKHILKRISILAKEAYKFVDKCIMDWKSLQIMDLFVPSLQGYNVLIYLKPNMNPLKYMQVSSTGQQKQDKDFKFYDKSDSKLIPIINFNPVEMYLQELRKNYAELALFFHDSYGGNVIGILWMKHTLQEKEFKIENVSGRKYYNNKLILDIDTILQDFYILGDGLVQDIKKL